jgi:hypothetical protein
VRPSAIYCHRAHTQNSEGRKWSNGGALWRAKNRNSSQDLREKAQREMDLVFGRLESVRFLAAGGTVAGGGGGILFCAP